MPVIHPNTLFHFTKKLTNLQSILQNGLRLSYCFEEFVDGNGIALPMVCFCDIPLLRTPQHREKYGYYMIGLTKDFFRKDSTFELNPVMYRYSDIIKPAKVNAISKQMDNLSEACIKDIQQYIDKNGISSIDIQELLKNPDIYAKTAQNVIETAYLLYSYAFSKLYATEKDGETINNYDECEWRYVYPYSYNNKVIWKLDIDASKFDKGELNTQLWENDDCRIIIPQEEICKSISFIVVNTDEEIKDMINFIRDAKTIFGNSITQEQKDIIISKITSFESIEANY